MLAGTRRLHNFLAGGRSARLIAGFMLGLLIGAVDRSLAQGDAGRLTGPTEHLSDNSAGFSAQLDYFVRPDDVLLVFGIGATGHPVIPLPSLAIQGRVLDRLLGQLAARHPELPGRLAVRFGASRTGLVEALDARLAQPGADWDGVRGRPRRGQFGQVLQDNLSAVVNRSELAQAVAAHGYRLSLTGMNRTDVGAVQALGGAKLPTDITIMQFEARRLPDKD